METSLKDLMAEKLGSAKRAVKKPKLHMNIHKLDDGKFMVEHDYRGQEPTPERTQHAPANMKELISHIGKHFSEPGDSAAEEKAEPAAEAAAEPKAV